MPNSNGFCLVTRMLFLRLFSEALSLQGRFQAMESRFWNKLEFVTLKTLAELWKAREEIETTAMGMFAAVVNEFANGNITHRPWGAILSTQALLEVLQIGLVNVAYLTMRSYKGGVDQKPICRAFSYLILCALDILPAAHVTGLIADKRHDARGCKEYSASADSGPASFGNAGCMQFGLPPGYVAPHNADQAHKS